MTVVPSLDEIGAFASNSVLDTLRERYDSGTFSRDLWRRMGDLGLLGLGVSDDLGGTGGDQRYVSEAVMRFAHDGCDMGLTLSWITHLTLCVKSIELLGTEVQKARYLPKLISGEWVGAAAISETGTGAHPGGIETTALDKGGSFLLNGSKLYTTDGTVADLLIVVARTGVQQDGKNELTAFIVETSMEGFSASPMDLDFVRTSPHAKLCFKDLELREDSVLGEVGLGHSEVSRSAFGRERAMVVSAGVGVFKAAAQETAKMISACKGGFDEDNKLSRSWIGRMSALEVYKRLSWILADAASEGMQAWRSSMDLLIYMGISYASWASWLNDVIARKRIEVAFPLDILLNDMKLISTGDSLLYKEGRRRYIEPYDESGGG